MNIILDNFKKFDDEYERLEVSPYNAAYDYYASGWNDSLITLSNRIANECGQCHEASDVVDLVFKIIDDLNCED